MAIITGAAANLVAYMLNGQVDAVRSWVGRIFRAGSEEEQSTSLRTVEDDTVALARGTVSEADVKARWGLLLAAYLAEHPEIQADIEAVANSTPTATETTNIGQQHNHGSGTFIGRDNYGGIAAPRNPND
ncbi:hypothetical protein ABZ801_16210 [Actinomadura sp. NPDC047616]|uniref:hypothetical protein n=1 Tax=Actinomadura sp. NPDC047616 TaxID=3155914 RepID=UPI0033E380F1